jgi:hypothetical protein
MVRFICLCLTLSSCAVIASSRQVTCLADTLYYEARNQPVTAQERIVAHVTLNRAADLLGKGSIVRMSDLNVCRIVSKRAQYSWYGKKLPILEPRMYMKAISLSRSILSKPYYRVGATRYFNGVSLGIRYKTPVRATRIAMLLSY